MNRCLMTTEIIMSLSFMYIPLCLKCFCIDIDLLTINCQHKVMRVTISECCVHVIDLFSIGNTSNTTEVWLNNSSICKICCYFSVDCCVCCSLSKTETLLEAQNQYEHILHDRIVLLSKQVRGKHINDWYVEQTESREFL